MYYRYVDRMHVEPKKLVDLFEFMHYADMDGKLERYYASMLDLNKGK